MSSTNLALTQPLRPSSRRLLVSTLIAVIVAALILFGALLPAEYGVDPLGVGRVLGLTSLGEAKQVAEKTRPGAPMHSHPRQARSARITIDVKPREELEYKADLEQGEPLLYSWSVVGGPVYFEFHGEPTEGEWPKDFYQSYDIKESSVEAHGSFVAPFTGRHGWYWRNLSDQPVSITLEAAGYYTRLGRIE